MQIAHPSFLRRTLPAIEGAQVRLAHTRPAFENVSLHGDVFSQVSVYPLLPAALAYWWMQRIVGLQWFHHFERSMRPILPDLAHYQKRKKMKETKEYTKKKKEKGK